MSDIDYPTIEQIEQMDMDGEGMCLACGAIRGCCEPDAENYLCDECGARKVMGAANMALEGYVKLS